MGSVVTRIRLFTCVSGLGQKEKNVFSETLRHQWCSHLVNLSTRSRILFLLFPMIASALMLSGCVVPGYPYGYGAPPPPPGTMVAPAPVPPVIMATSPIVPAPVPAVAVLPYGAAPATVVIAPTFYAGWGWGYWWGNRFWPYRPNCGFWHGRYYNGYRWNAYRPGYHGGPYHVPATGWQGSYR